MLLVLAACNPSAYACEAARMLLPVSRAPTTLDTARFTSRPELDEAAALRYLAWVLVRPGDPALGAIHRTITTEWKGTAAELLDAITLTGEKWWAPKDWPARLSCCAGSSPGAHRRCVVSAGPWRMPNPTPTRKSSAPD